MPLNPIFRSVISALLLLLTAFSPVARAFGSSPAISASNDALREQVLTTWTTDQGLPQNFIRAITQTSDGFLWIGTMNGLVRFDGLRFRAPGPDLPAALQGNISGLAPDAGAGLWAATGGGLFHLAHHRFELISVAGQPAAALRRIDAIARSHTGELWVYGEKHLYLTRNNALEAHPLPDGALAIRDLAESTDGTLWLADGEAVFAVKLLIKDATPSYSQAIRYPLAGARMLYADEFGSLYAGDGHKLFRFTGGKDGSAFSEVKNPGLGNFVSVLVDHEHCLWMASGGLHGLSRKSGGTSVQTTRVDTLTTNEGLASNDVRVLFEDRSHDVWIGTISGLERLHHGIFSTYSNAAGNFKSQFESIFQNRDGTMWAGTLESGIVQLPASPLNPWHRFARDSGLRIGQVRGFAEDGPPAAGNTNPVVAIADYGLYYYRAGRYSRIPGVPPGYVGTPVTTADGSLWFAIQRRGIFRLGPRDRLDKLPRNKSRPQGTSITQLGPADGLPADPNVLWALALDSRGELWVGAGTQLYHWNQTRFDLVLTAPSPILSIARSPKPDEEPASVTSGLILGTLDGVFFPGDSSSRQSRILTEQEGLPGNTVVDVLEDDGNHLWVATARAIARISASQWTDFAQGRSSRVQSEIYTRADGLRSNTVLPLNQITAVRSHDGRIWFATADGISVLHPDAAPARFPEASIDASIDAITVDDRERSLSDSAVLTVPPGQHRITFAFSTPPVQAPEQVRFRYRLSGWDHHWLDAINTREVSYTALPPGRYTFEVIAVTRSGIGSALPASIQLRLRPFFWQTRWFLAIAIVAAALIIVEITRRRTRAGAERLSFQFQERAAERERIAYQIHDTVIQDMIGTVLQLELLSFQMDEKPEKASSHLVVLTQRLREAVARSRNMVSSLHSTAVVQLSLVEVLRHAEAEFRLGESPKFELSSSGVPRDIHPLIRDEVYRICREALANAFRHANASNVHVIVRFLPELLEVEIGDDGEGIDEEIRLHGRPGHFGLPGIHAHAQRINASIEIASAPRQGTRILLRVPTQRPKWQKAWSWSKRFRRQHPPNRFEV